MATNIIHLYDTLRKTIGDVNAEAIATFINGKMERGRQRDAETLASKIDLNDLRIELKEEINDLRVEVKEYMASLKIELKHDINGLSEKITETKTDMARWAFTLFITITLAFISLYLKK